MELQKEVKALIELRKNSVPELAKKSRTSISTINRVLKDEDVSEGMLLKLKANLS